MLGYRHSFAPSESNLKTTKSAHGKRHPSEKQNAGEVTIRPQQRSEAWGKEIKKCKGHSAQKFGMKFNFLREKYISDPENQKRSSKK